MRNTYTKLTEEEKAEIANTTNYMQVKSLIDKMNKGGKKRMADALKKSLGMISESKEQIQQNLQQLQQQQYNLEAVINQVRQTTKAIKHDDTIHGIMNGIKQLAQKAGIDASELRYAENQVLDAFNELESAVYGLEEAFTDKLRDVQNQVEDLEYELENPDELDEVAKNSHGHTRKQQAAIAMAKQGVAEANGKLTYTPEPTEYGVFPDSKNEFVKTFLSRDLALAHIKKFGGKLIVLDQHGRRMKEGVAEGAPELLKAEMPLVRHIERELTQHGYEKGTSEYNEHFKHALAYYRKFGNIDAIKKGVAEGIQFLPIDKFPKTDDENQSELYLKTKDGNVYVGEWDSASGYFFATDIVHGNHPAGNELPGRMYNRPVAFAVKQGVAEASSPAQQAAIAIAKKKKAGVKESIAEDHSTATGGWGQGSYNTASKDTSRWTGDGHSDAVRENPEWYNDEANSMTTSQLKSLVKHAAKLRHAVKQMQAQGDTLEPWQQSKVTKAADYLDAVFNAVDDEHDMGESEDHPDEKEDKALIRKMVKQQALKQEDSYMEALSAKLGEKLKANDPVDKYINDFSKAAKTPNAKGHHQFKNKSPEKVRQMAIAASYGAKNKSKKK